ncbi:MAG: helix-turn-helix domain-containing protein, partial [Candidatus Woesearchaeota archaeon]
KPVTYNPEIHPCAILSLYANGLTDEQVAEGIGVNRNTLHKWRKKYPELSDTEKEKAIVDGKVEMMLNKRCLGYETDEVEIISHVNADGQLEGNRRIKKSKRHIPPDTTAQIFWLKNRQPKKWRDRKEVTVEDNTNFEKELLGIIDEANEIESKNNA